MNLIDVRTPEEVAEFNIGGIDLPLSEIQSLHTESIEFLKDQEVICYCRSGNRSMRAGLILERLGFSDVKNMAGGTEAYRMMD